MSDSADEDSVYFLLALAFFMFMACAILCPPSPPGCLVSRADITEALTANDANDDVDGLRTPSPVTPVDWVSDSVSISVKNE